MLEIVLYQNTETVNFLYCILIHLQGVQEITVAKTWLVDLAQFVRLFRSDWLRAELWVTARIWANQIEKAARIERMRLFPPGGLSNRKSFLVTVFWVRWDLTESSGHKMIFKVHWWDQFWQTFRVCCSQNHGIDLIDWMQFVSLNYKLNCVYQM